MNEQEKLPESLSDLSSVDDVVNYGLALAAKEAAEKETANWQNSAMSLHGQIEVLETRIAELKKTSYLPMIPEGKYCWQGSGTVCRFEQHYHCIIHNQKVLFDDDACNILKCEDCTKPVQEEK